MSLSAFSKTNQRKISHCRDCIDGVNHEPNENEWVNDWVLNEPCTTEGSKKIGTGFDVFDINPKIRISDITAQNPQDVVNGDNNEF